MVTYFNPCKESEGIIKIRKISELKAEIGHASSIDSVITIERLDQQDRSVAIQDQKRLYSPREDLTLAYEIYRFKAILNKDHKIHYDLDHPLLWVPVQATYDGILGGAFVGPDNKLHQEPIDLILKPEDLDVLEYVRDSILVEQARLIERLTGIKPTTWLSRENQSTGNYTNIWPTDELAKLVEQYKIVFENYSPDLDVTEHLVRGKVKRNQDAKRVNIALSANLKVLNLLERRAMGYGNPQPIAA